MVIWAFYIFFVKINQQFL